MDRKVPFYHRNPTGIKGYHIQLGNNKRSRPWILSGKLIEALETLVGACEFVGDGA
jgi:hypothetical protein